jgi:hypothetical protein
MAIAPKPDNKDDRASCWVAGASVLFDLDPIPARRALSEAKNAINRASSHAGGDWSVTFPGPQRILGEPPMRNSTLEYRPGARCQR